MVSILFSQMAIRCWTNKEIGKKYIWDDNVLQYLKVTQIDSPHSMMVQILCFFGLAIPEAKYWVTVEVLILDWHMRVYDYDLFVVSESLFKEKM